MVVLLRNFLVAVIVAVLTYFLLHLIFNQFWSGLVAVVLGLIVFLGAYNYYGR